MLWCVVVGCGVEGGEGGGGLKASSTGQRAVHMAVLNNALEGGLLAPGTKPLGRPIVMLRPKSSVRSIEIAVVASSSFINSTNAKRPACV